MASESMETKEEFHLFGAKESPLHPHHKAEFQVDGVKYNFIEQYVLHKKAETYKSTKDIAELMKITDPNHLNKFDKKLIVLDAKVWEAKLKEFMKKGYLEKGRQVKALFDLLEDTRGKILVYASRKDSVLGIGVDANDPLSRRRSNWKGKNLLGDWLMEVRDELPSQLESSFDDVSSKQESRDGSPRHKQTGDEEESNGPEKFTFFWKAQSPFSQWHPCSFIIDGQWYNCAEQYMMHQKAVTFGDHETSEKILKSKDPKEQKNLGRKVSDFDDDKWSRVAMNVVKKGNLAKFGQSEKLRETLFATRGTTLVEASPVDNIWGIGLEAKDPRAKDRSQWLGKNQLGEVLTEVREELMCLEGGKLPSKDGERSVVAGEKDDAAKRAKRKADDVNPGPERKTTEGVTDAKVPKGPVDPTAVRKDVDQRKGDSQGGKERKDRKERPNSSQRKDGKGKEEKNSVEMRSEVESHGETPRPVVEKMECSDAGEGNEVVEGMGDPGWEGLNTMEVDIDETEKKKRERSKDDSQGWSDKERTLKKGKPGYSSRNERDKPAAGSKSDDKASSEKFTFFWRADSPFSQHHLANFTIDGVSYNCAEQYMMHQKAVVFKDEKIGYEIMHSENPAKQKSLAKQVEGFNEVHWKTLRRDVVKRGNIAKFSQNPRLRRMLFATAGTTMVEASPLDGTWGIALHADDPKAWHRGTWLGGNLLGEILTEVREELMEKFKNVQEDEDSGMNYKDFSQGNKGGRDEQYTIFWRPVSPFHPRYPVGFELDKQFYQTLQQYLLHEKALFFNDSATARAIMENTRPNKLDELGRNIRNYDHHSWSKFCRSYLRLGNFAKFSQNPNIGQQLIDNVQHGELVYAVEEDSLLGVGLKDGDKRLYQRQYWKGKNLLGRALMEVRDMLMKDEQKLPEIAEDPDDEVVDELPNSSQETSEHQFQFFFTKSPLNQWHLCRFKIGSIQYNSAEQYMIHQMALHFRDHQAAEEALRCSHPRDMQNIDIPNYEQRNWEKACKEIITKGNRAKFTQDYRLREELLKTEDSFLAYASTKDVLLGIGLRDTDPLVYDQQNWPGYNILGEVLMEIRGELKSQPSNGNNNSNGAWRSDSKEMIPRLRNDQPAEKFTFFWLKSPFSQWWRSNISIDDITYNCSEQYMMHQKALFFSDLKTANDIMKTYNPSQQWQLGRQVRGYANDKWNEVCRDIVKKGNFEKFSQNRQIRQELFETAGTTLVEASPKDCKWGIGVMQGDPRAGRRETWLGENLLGQILTEVRDELMKQEADNPQTSSARNIPGSGQGRDRRGSEQNNNSQGRRKDSDSNPKGGFSHEASSSYEKPRYDHGGGAAGRPYQQQYRDGGHQWSNQHSRSERGDTMGRPTQFRRDGGNERPQHNTRSFYGERPHAAEPRPYRDGDRQYRDGDRQRRPMGFQSDQRRNSREEEQIPVQEFKSVSSGQHSDRHFTRKTRSTPGGQQSQQRPGAHDLHSSVPADCSKVAQSDGAQDLPSGGCNTDAKVVDGAVSNENFHIVCVNSDLSLWYHANFEVDRFKYRNVGQYLSHQKALRFNDGVAADEIMKSTSVQRIIKSDKYVDGFDERNWNRIYKDVVKDGNYFKFSQNEDLKQKLLATSGSHLVYADFKDWKLGVGLKSDDRHIRNRKKWKGENVFGSMLELVREDLLHGRDSTKRSRDQGSVDQSNRNSVPESIEEGERRDVQAETVDGDMKAAVTSGDSLVQKREHLQTAANHEKESLQETAVLEKETLEVPAIPEKGSLNDSAEPEKENVQDAGDSDKESLLKTAVPEKESFQKAHLQSSAVPEKENVQDAGDSHPGPKSAIKVVELSGTSEVQHKDEAVETRLNSSQVTKDSVQTIEIPQREAVRTVAQPDSSSETERVAKKDLKETEVDVNDSVLEGTPELEFHPESHQTASHDKEVSDSTSTSETETTSQNQAYDAQKHEDTQTTEPQALATDKLLGTEKDDNTSEPGADKLSKDSVNAESHEECTSTADKTLQVESGIEDMVEQASTTVKNEREDESSTENQPEEATSASITEDVISQEKASLKQEVGKEGSAEGSQEVVEKDAFENQTENECLQKSMTPVDKSTSDAEIIAEKPDEKDSNECCEQEENCNTVQEVKSSKEGLDDKSLAEQTPLPAEKEIIEDNTRTEDSCKETEPVTEASDDRNEEKLDDKSSVESIPGEASTPVGVSTGCTEASCQETKDKLSDQTEAQLGDESSVESTPEVASAPPTALKEVLVTQTSPDKSKQQTTLVKEELVGKVEEASDDESSVESDRAEANSMVGEKEEVSEPLYVEGACPDTSTKVEIDGTSSAEVEASQQATDVFGTKEDRPALTDLQTGERNSETGENCDETSQVDDGRGKTQTETNPVHQVSSHS